MMYFKKRLWDEIMLETLERIKLLKAGFTGKMVEKLYVKHNNFKIIRTLPIIELVEFDSLQNRKTCKD